jgi:hypothetical protein
MPHSKTAAAQARGDRFVGALAGWPNTTKHSPHHIEKQHAARRYLLEANALSGADAHAAHALARHYGRGVGGRHD